MILAGISTVSNGRLLTTGGQVNIKAFKDGKELVLSPFNNFNIQMPTINNEQNMSIYYGEITSDSVINWEEAIMPNDSIRDTLAISRLFLEAERYYIFPTQIGWINIDKLASINSVTTTISCNSSKPEASKILKYIYFPELKSVMQIYGNEQSQLPVGERAKFVFIAYSESEKIYFQAIDAVIEENMKIEIQLKEATKELLIEELSKL
jgi:hypothetical protein